MIENGWGKSDNVANGDREKNQHLNFRDFTVDGMIAIDCKYGRFDQTKRHIPSALLLFNAKSHFMIKILDGAMSLSHPIGHDRTHTQHTHIHIRLQN